MISIQSNQTEGGMVFTVSVGMLIVFAFSSMQAAEEFAQSLRQAEEDEEEFWEFISDEHKKRADEAWRKADEIRVSKARSRER